MCCCEPPYCVSQWAPLRDALQRFCYLFVTRNPHASPSPSALVRRSVSLSGRSLLHRETSSNESWSMCTNIVKNIVQQPKNWTEFSIGTKLLDLPVSGKSNTHLLFEHSLSIKSFISSIQLLILGNVRKSWGLGHLLPFGCYPVLNPSPNPTGCSNVKYETVEGYGSTKWHSILKSKRKGVSFVGTIH